MCEPEYDSGIDMWSVGCILAEMLNVTDSYQRREGGEFSRVLFTGTSCFPLSPCEEMLSQQDEQFNVVSFDDQLVKIIQNIGQIDESDASFISEPTAKDYFDTVNNENGYDSNNLA